MASTRPIPAPINTPPLNGNMALFTAPWAQWFSQSVTPALGYSSSPGTDLPKMNGTAAPGVALQLYSMQDHVHPTDTSRLGVLDTAADSSELGGIPAALYALDEDIPYAPVFPCIPDFDPHRTQVVFMQTGDKTISNTTTETSMFNSGVGSLTLPANAYRPGAVLRIRINGYISSDNPAGASTIRIKLGGVTLLTSTGTLASGLTTEVVSLDFPIQCRTVGATGTFIGNGITLVHGGPGIAAMSGRNMLMTAPATVNTTVPTALDITYQWATGSAANILVITNAEVTLRYVR